MATKFRSQIDPGVPISFVAAETDFSGSFIVSGWATTTVIDGLDTYTSTSSSKTMAVNIDAVIDAAIFEAFNSTGFEDAGRNSSGAIEPDGKTKDQFIDAHSKERYGVATRMEEKAKLVLEIKTAMLALVIVD